MSFDSAPLASRTFTPAATHALLHTSESLTSSIDEDELLSRFCENAVQSGNYVLAWYGRVDRRDSASVIAVAVAGVASAYVNGLDVRSDDSQSGRGPVGQAFRTGRIATVREALTPKTGPDSPDFSPWRDRAAAYGIKSCTAIPVMVNGEVDGVLAVYSDRANTFDDQADAIHQAMARQVGIGIERLRALNRYVASLKGTVRALSATIDTRDIYTAGHQAAVSAIAEKIARVMGLTDFEIEGIAVAGLIHDIGKIAVPAQILLKPELLTWEERQLVQTHAAVGERILSSIDFPWPVATVVGAHHERLDGTGYPRQLDGRDIGIETRIISVADVFDALAANRPYRAGYSHQEVNLFIADHAGTKFDRDVVAALHAIPTDALQANAFGGGHPLPPLRPLNDPRE